MQCHCVSIHATLAGGDGLHSLLSLAVLSFLSTPPSRVATASRVTEEKEPEKFLSTPPSRVATLAEVNAQTMSKVSIHATLAGGDCQGSKTFWTD